MSESPLLPPQYELVQLEGVDSVVEEARRRAAAGAPEGTVVQAREQRAARTRRGREWHSPPGNLHCAMVLRPEGTRAEAWQIAYVAALAAGAAVAGLLEPLVALRYRWPNRLLLNDLLAGRLELAAPAEAGPGHPWLVVGLCVNVAFHPPQPEPERFASMLACGSPLVTPDALLEDYARWFLSWINRWAEEGFAPVHRAWTMRADDLGEPGAIALASETVAGRAVEVDARGDLVVEGPVGARRAVSVGEYFGIA